MGARRKGGFGKARASAGKKRQSPERDFQRALVKHLSVMFGSDVFWTHFPSGVALGGWGRERFIRGDHLKKMGLKPGVPDILIIYDGKAHWLELKSAKGGLSEAQYDTLDDLSAAGSWVCVVRTLAEAFRAIDAWGIPTRIASQDDISAKRSERPSNNNTHTEKAA